MDKIVAGFLSGFAATVVLSLFMAMMPMTSIMPDLDLIHLLTQKMGTGVITGWADHVMIGVVGYGLAFALIFYKPSIGGQVIHGIVLGMAGWLVMMTIMMPMMGVGLFGLSIGGMTVPVFTLSMHILFGTVLGWVYSRLMNFSNPLSQCREDAFHNPDQNNSDRPQVAGNLACCSLHQ